MSPYCSNCGIHVNHASPTCGAHGTDIAPEALYEPKSVYIDPARSDEDLLEQFTREAMERGYSDDASVKIANERIAHLRAGGNGHGRLPVTPAVDPNTIDLTKATLHTIDGEEVTKPADGSQIEGTIGERPDDAPVGEQVSGETATGEQLPPVADASNTTV